MMIRRYRSVVTLLLAFVFAASLLAMTGCKSETASVGGEPETPVTDTPSADSAPVVAVSGEEVMAGACSQCHDPARVFVQPYAVDWSTIVDQMIDAHGAALSEEERVAVIEFLGSRELSEGEKVVAAKCGECHDAQRIYEQGDGADWAAIVQQMAEVHGADLTEEERAAAVEFLDDL